MVASLPAFQPPRSATPPPRLDEASDLYRWADNYLDTNVLNSMRDLVRRRKSNPLPGCPMTHLSHLRLSLPALNSSLTRPSQKRWWGRARLRSL